ncbi:MAG: hypothetical protein Q7U54_03750 [Bacteroidales bacterium]|nr:hypothetical protein [Bacteroidales bacterium]
MKKLSNNLIRFEYLSSPSRTTVGDKEQIKANAPSFNNNTESFVSSNAKGVLRTFSNIEKAEDIGRESAKSLAAIFA